MAEFVTRVPADGACSLALSGEVDIASVDELLTAAHACLDTDVRVLEIDLGEVTFIDSSGLGALVRIRNEAAALGKDLVLVRVTPAAERILAVTGLSDLFGTR
ncbi:MAG: anti-sigma-factor antagonist [Marmoricola sp.]|nr:anti-sigma-factor antagonist [Marmoricola sp.]